MDIVICPDFHVDPAVFTGVFPAALHGFRRTAAAPELYRFVDRKRDLPNLTGTAGTQCDGKYLIGKGTFPLIVMQRRAAVAGVGMPGNPLRLMHMAQSDVVSLCREDVARQQKTAAQLHAAL